MRFRDKLDALIWALVCLIPLISMIVLKENYSAVINSLCPVNIFQPIQNAMNNAGMNIPNELYLTGIWIAYTQIIHLMIDLVMLLPNLCKKLVKGFIE